MRIIKTHQGVIELTNEGEWKATTSKLEKQVREIAQIERKFIGPSSGDLYSSWLTSVAAYFPGAEVVDNEPKLKYPRGVIH